MFKHSFNLLHFATTFALFLNIDDGVPPEFLTTRSSRRRTIMLIHQTNKMRMLMRTVFLVNAPKIAGKHQSSLSLSLSLA